MQQSNSLFLTYKKASQPTKLLYVIDLLIMLVRKSCTKIMKLRLSIKLYYLESERSHGSYLTFVLSVPLLPNVTILTVYLSFTSLSQEQNVLIAFMFYDEFLYAKFYECEF